MGEKGGLVRRYEISAEGLQAIHDYVENERKTVAKAWNSISLFLQASTVAQSAGQMAVNVGNQIWNEVAALADVEGKTPHSARYAMWQHIIEKTGNIAAVQRQLGHKNATCSMQYARISERELTEAIESARIRGGSRARITAMVKAGKLRPYPVGEQYLLLRSEVENCEPQRAGRPPKAVKRKSSSE